MAKDYKGAMMRILWRSIWGDNFRVEVSRNEEMG